MSAAPLPARLRSALTRRLACFARDARGALSVEAALISPFLLGLFAVSFVWFDAFRTKNEVVKSTYTVADMISRQQASLPEEAFDGLAFAFDYMIKSGASKRLRFTSMVCKADCDDPVARELEMCWSWASGNFSPHDTTTVKGLHEAIPLMTLGDTVVVTEGAVDYHPIFDRWLGDIVLRNTIVTRPRFAPEIAYEDQECF
jgi:hypothetical protein